MIDAKQPFTWYGSKVRWLDLILPNLPHDHRYVEPFGGSGAVLLNREPSPIEAFNDLEDSVMTFFEVLRDEPDELLEAIKNTPYHEAEFERAQETSVDEVSDLEYARRFYLTAKASFNSSPTSGFSYSTTTSRRGMAAHTSRFWSSLEELEAVAERLRRVQFFNRDAIDLIETYDSPDTVQYLDPPYPPSTRGDASNYQFEMDREEHERLLETVRGCDSRVAISTYQCDLYDGLLLSGWNRIDSEEKETAASNKDQARTEALYVNYEVPDDGFELPDRDRTKLTDFCGGVADG